MLELFGVLFITLFIAFLLTLVILNLDMMFKKGKVEKIVNEDVVESEALKDCYKAWKDFDLSWDFGSNKDRSVSTRYKQKHGETIEFIDCKLDEDWKEVNEVQEKYLGTLPKHKTRVKNRNKRQRKK